MIRVYVMPTTGGGHPGNPRRPAYLELGTFGAVYYGAQDTCLAVADVSQAEHDAIVTNSDVLSAPLTLDNNLTSGAVTAVQNYLEGINLPAQWVDTTYTYREVVRKIGHFFWFAQRYSKISGKQVLIPDGFDMSTIWSNVPAQKRADILATADSFGIDYSSLNPSNTVRQILKFLVDYWEGMPLTLHGVEI